MPCFKYRLPLIGAAVIFILGSGIALQAQAPDAKRPAFGVTSAKLNKNCTAGSQRAILTPATVRLPCAPVKTLIRLAYGALNGEAINARILEVVGGPGWLDSELYDIEARPENSATAGQLVGPMLQALLEERFQLKVHTEAREKPVYILSVAEPSANLRQIKPGDCVPIDLFKEASRVGPSDQKQCGNYRGGTNPKGAGMALDFSGITMAEFAGRMLETYTGRPVIDKTGLDGRFDFHLEFIPSRPQGPVQLNGEMVVLPPSDPAESGAGSIFGALQKQLGLKLTAGKAPVDVLVIDRIERPSEN
jgi:uncharacterized protein (TIGR03435 family)